MRRPGARLEQLRELLGHASIETTSVYVHQTAKDLEAAVLARETPNALAADAERRRRRRDARRG
jgi:site-specific recombinase XerD